MAKNKLKNPNFKLVDLLDEFNKTVKHEKHGQPVGFTVFESNADTAPINNSKTEFNDSYITKAIKWAIRNEMRRRYKWHVMKNSDSVEKEQVKDAVYKTILSIEEMAEAENPTLIKDNSRNPEEKAEVVELKNRICEAMKKLPQREQDLIEAKYFYDKKLKDISAEFNISQSRISRIIQNGLDKIKKELLKQEELDEDNI